MWGGVVPKLAQEAHKAAIDATVDEALRRAGICASQLSAVAVTVGPGLSLCLEVGVRKAIALTAAHQLPLVRCHHMEAHAMVTWLPSTSPPPRPPPLPSPPDAPSPAALNAPAAGAGVAMDAPAAAAPTAAPAADAAAPAPAPAATAAATTAPAAAAAFEAQASTWAERTRFVPTMSTKAPAIPALPAPTGAAATEATNAAAAPSASATAPTASTQLSPDGVPPFPFLTLLVSGGHNLLVLTTALGTHAILGATLDDSIGEAFDKTARLLGIAQIPGGPVRASVHPAVAHCLRPTAL